MSTAVVIGGNRGIGIGFVTHYLEAGYDVVATYRDQSKLDAETILEEGKCESLTHLQEVYADKLKLYQLDTTDHDSVAQFAKTVAKVDLLILNSGIKGYSIPGTRPQGHTSKDLIDAFNVNTIAHNEIVRNFYPLLLENENSCAVYMSSLVGRTADNTGGGYHPYRASKAAFNALIWNWSIELMLDWKKLNPKNLTNTPTAFAVCPGWVRTDMGGANARLSVNESVQAMSKCIDQVRGTKKSNALYMYDGTVAESYAVPDVLQEVLAEKSANPA